MTRLLSTTEFAEKCRGKRSAEIGRRLAQRLGIKMHRIGKCFYVIESEAEQAITNATTGERHERPHRQQRAHVNNHAIRRAADI